MTVFLNAHFDGATSGTITAVNETGISAVTGSAITFSGANAFQGAAAALTAVGSACLLHQILGTPANQIYWRTYLKMTGTNTGGQVVIIAARDSVNTNCATIAINTSGNIVVRDGSTNQATSSYVLTTSSGWVRLEWRVDRGGANNQTLEIYHGANLEGGVPNETLNAPCTSGTSPIYRASFGMVGASTGAQFVYDEAVLADSHVGAFSPITYTVKVWDGASEVAVSSVTVWNGSSEVSSSVLGTQP